MRRSAAMRVALECQMDWRVSKEINMLLEVTDPASCSSEK
jgi:hypothetical protein